MNVDDATALFRRVLENPDATPEANFFDLGGDSLLATRVLSAVARTTGVELTFDDFLMAPTPATLAAAVEAASPPLNPHVPDSLARDYLAHEVNAGEAGVVGGSGLGSRAPDSLAGDSLVGEASRGGGVR